MWGFQNHVCPSVCTPRKEITIASQYQPYISNWYINGKVFTNTTPWKLKILSPWCSNFKFRKVWNLNFDLWVMTKSWNHLKGLLDRDSFASQLATQMQMERLHPKIEMLLMILSCRVPCIYTQASHCAALQQCAASVLRERVLLTRSPNGWDHFKQRCNSLVDWRMKARY